MRLIDLDKIKPMDFPSHEMDGLDVVRYLNTLPTIKAAPVVHGRWRVETDEEEPNPMFKLVVCCVCGKTASNMGNYCPNCGAKMDGRSEGE